MKKVLACALVAWIASFGVSAAVAQTKITIGSTPGTSGAAFFVAKEEGFFAKHDIDAHLTQVALSANLPAALVAGSIDVGFMPVTVFLQAVEGGVDLVAVSGGSVTSHRVSDMALVAGNGTGIKGASDLIGRKVGVPGIGATLHVMFRYWLQQNGIDFHRVNFVETPFTQERDILAGKSVEAVLATDPFISQMTAAGVGTVAVSLNASIPANKPLVLHIATRVWADAHRKDIEAYRAAIAEGAAFVTAEPEKTRTDMNVYTKLPPAVIKDAEIADQAPQLKIEDIGWWLEAMKQQDMLPHDLDPSTLVAK